MLLDGIAEAVVLPSTSRDRAEVIHTLVQEIDEVVRWRHVLDEGDAEVQSLETIVLAASQHLERMKLADEDERSVATG